MGNIAEYLRTLRTAVFGKDVRESIAQSIEQTYEDATRSGNANMEVSDARGYYSSLKNRLEGDKNDLQTQINGLASGSPLVASSVSEMTDTSRVYVNTTDGHWYTYDGTSWQDGGVYQATEDSTTLLEVKNITDNITDISFSQEVHTLETGYLKTNNTVDTSFGKHIIAEVTPGETIQFSCTAISNLRAYILRDSSHNIVSMASQDVSLTPHTNESLIIPSGVAEIVINTSNSLNIAFYRSNIKVPYSAIAIPENSINKNKLEEFISNIFIDKYEPIECTINSGKFINYTNGNIEEVNSTNYIEIPVIEGEKYKITGKHGQNLKLYILKDDNNNIINYYPITQVSQQTTETSILEIPENGHLYINSYNPLSILLVSKLSGYRINSDDNPLNNKKVYFFGDSITAGNGSWGDVNTIRNENNMSGNNFAVGGMTFTVKQNSDASNNILLRIKQKIALDNNVDYIILQGGVNDAFQSLTKGTPLGNNDFTTQCDTSTFSGAFEDAIRYILTEVPECKVGFIINAKIPRLPILNQYMEIAKSICEKYSVPTLDFYNESGLCAGIQSINNEYFLHTITPENGDGTHPTPIGYEKYLNNKVENFMKSL